MSLVSNVMVSWQEMDGDSEDLKKLNSLLTSALVSPKNMPPDKCAEHAKVLLDYFIAIPHQEWLKAAAEYLQGAFGDTSSPEEYAAVVKRADRIMWGGHWPDRLVVV